MLILWIYRVWISCVVCLRAVFWFRVALFYSRMNMVPSRHSSLVPKNDKFAFSNPEVNDRVLEKENVWEFKPKNGASSTAVTQVNRVLQEISFQFFYFENGWIRIFVLLRKGWIHTKSELTTICWCVVQGDTTQIDKVIQIESLTHLSNIAMELVCTLTNVKYVVKMDCLFCVWAIKCFSIQPRFLARK